MKNNVLKVELKNGSVLIIDTIFEAKKFVSGKIQNDPSISVYVPFSYLRQQILLK